MAAPLSTMKFWKPGKYGKVYKLYIWSICGGYVNECTNYDIILNQFLSVWDAHGSCALSAAVSANVSSAESLGITCQNKTHILRGKKWYIYT